MSVDDATARVSAWIGYMAAARPLRLRPEEAREAYARGEISIGAFEYHLDIIFGLRRPGQARASARG